MDFFLRQIKAPDVQEKYDWGKGNNGTKIDHLQSYARILKFNASVERDYNFETVNGNPESKLRCKLYEVTYPFCIHAWLHILSSLYHNQ